MKGAEPSGKAPAKSTKKCGEKTATKELPDAEHSVRD